MCFQSLLFNFKLFQLTILFSPDFTISLTSNYKTMGLSSLSYTLVVWVSSQLLVFLSHSFHWIDRDLVLIKELQSLMVSGAINLLQLAKGESTGGCLELGLSCGMLQCHLTNTPLHNTGAYTRVPLLLTSLHLSKALRAASLWCEKRLQ